MNTWGLGELVCEVSRKVGGQSCGHIHLSPRESAEPFCRVLLVHTLARTWSCEAPKANLVGVSWHPIVALTYINSFLVMLSIFAGIYWICGFPAS